MLLAASTASPVAAWPWWWNWLCGWGAKSSDTSESETLDGGILPIPALEPVSAHELDLLATTLAGTGATVVTENSGAIVVLKATEPPEVEQLADGMMEAGNGQIVTSDSEGLLGWIIVAPTESTVEP